MLGVQAGERVLDMCAAPGMKSLYLHALAPDIKLYSNDLSADRIGRMRRLFDKHGVSAEITKSDARFLGDVYDEAFFDKVLIDAPCSGEGLAMVGNQKQAEAWSPAKVKRLQQLQIKILKTGWRLLRPGGTLVYATCTLNKNENERVIHKALKIDVTTTQAPLSLQTLPNLAHADSIRILPSSASIGFFMTVLHKYPEE
jgi:16S rRNA C967 or C1407 C5-methylase (RsmB/RsmF family)